MRLPRVRLRAVQIGVVVIAILLSIEAAHRRNFDWNSIRLDPGSEMVIFVNPSTASVALNAASGTNHTNGLSYEPLKMGTRVRVDSDTRPTEWTKEPNQEDPSLIVDNRDVEVTVLSGPQAGISGNVGRHFLRPAPPEKAEE